MFKSSATKMSPLLILLVLNLVAHSSSKEFKCTKSSLTYTSLPDKRADEDCKTKKCIAKCCPQGEIISPINRTLVCTKLTLNKTDDYSDFKIYRNDVRNKIEVSHDVTMKDFEFVYDARFSNKSCSANLLFESLSIMLYVLEDGSLEIKQGDKWTDRRNKLEYCVEYFKNVPSPGVYRTYHILDVVQAKDKIIVDNILAKGPPVSAFFLFLTLVVHILLRYYKNNVNGMIEMSHVGGLMIMFLLKVVIDNVKYNHVCKHVAPLYYFFVISNFLWLAVMSFNIWWTFRGNIKHREIHRRGVVTKFVVYCICIYGSTGVLTIFATIMDRADMSSHPNIQTPGFTACLSNNLGIMYYMYIPIAILISINCILFGMTLFNILCSIRKLKESFSSSETRKNQANFNSFKISAKLSITMGIGWIVEVAQMGSELPPKLDLVANLYNAYIGIVIFVLLITARSKIQMLRKRFTRKRLDLQKSSTINSRFTGSSKTNTKTEAPSFETVELSTVDKV